MPETYTYAVFYIKGAEEFADWRFFGMWHGKNAAEAVENSNISKAHGDATGVATILWGLATIYERTGWVES